MLLIITVLREIINGLLKSAHEHSKDHSIYRFDVPFLLGALRSIGRYRSLFSSCFSSNRFPFRISTSDQSLISQLFPTSFSASTQSIHIEQKDTTEISSTIFGSFRPILSTRLSKNLLSNDDDQPTSNEEENLPISTLFFSISGSTYYRQGNINSNRFRLSMTPVIFEQFHEVNSSPIDFLSEEIPFLDF